MSFRLTQIRIAKFAILVFMLIMVNAWIVMILKSKPFVKNANLKMNAKNVS
jgi:hypothetical protein